MAKAGRRTVASVVAAVLLATAGQLSANEETISIEHPRSTIVVHVANHAAVAPDLLAASMERVAAVYKGIGVRIEWDDRGVALSGLRAGALHLNLLLLSRDRREKPNANAAVRSRILGYAHLGAKRAYVFPNRIADLPGPPAYPGIALGDVVAHELGHLVLSTQAHSTRGIMRASLAWHSLVPHVFNDNEGRTIRAALMTSR